MKEAYKENGTNKKKSNAKYWLFVARFFGVFVLLFIAAFIYHKVTKFLFYFLFLSNIPSFTM